MKAHPFADMFPMMPEEELAELAEDIKGHGLIHPIILDAEGQLIDGRNRLAACKLAKVEPRFEKLDGRDPVAYIFSANIGRRHLTKSMQAMLTARMFPESEKGGRGKKTEARNLAETAKFSYRRLNEARAVLRHSPDLADAVIKGTISLDQALEKMNQSKSEESSTESKLAILLERAKDLFDRVQEEDRKDKLTLDEAMALLREREDREAGVRQEGRQAVDRLSEFASCVVSILSAMELGEPITISARTWEIIDGAYQNLDQKFRKEKKQ
jgi:hypothetical protein